MKVTFTKNVKYNGSYYDQGASYDLSDADVRTLKQEQGEEVFTSSTAPDTPVASPVEAAKPAPPPATPPAPKVEEGTA